MKFLKQNTVQPVHYGHSWNSKLVAILTSGRCSDVAICLCNFKWHPNMVVIVDRWSLFGACRLLMFDCTAHHNWPYWLKFSCLYCHKIFFLDFFTLYNLQESFENFISITVCLKTLKPGGFRPRPTYKQFWILVVTLFHKNILKQLFSIKYNEVEAMLKKLQSFGESDLARGPFFVHPCINSTYLFNSRKTNEVFCLTVGQ
jgi:hypothetical protein